MTEMTMVAALNAAFRQEMARDERVVVLGEDVGVNGGVFRVTDGLLRMFPGRVFDTPLAETCIVGAAVGMAAAGLRPVAEIQFDGFLTAAFDQLVSHAARLRNRSRGRFTCPLVVRAPFTGGIHAPEHHSESMEASYAHIPGLVVVMPSTPSEAKGLLAAAIRSPDPVLFLEPKKVYRAIKEDVREEEYAIPLGKARVVQEGTDVTVIAWGAMLVPALQAAGRSSYSCEVIDLRTVSPLDVPCILQSVEKTGRAVVVQEGPHSFGVGAEIAAQLAEKGILHLEAPVERVTAPDVPTPLAKLEGLYLPSAERVGKAIERAMAFR
ncbi:MAG: alpha-ketoacid dehydrogenase subunit beta [Candidatus Aenigmarchaeota archaeon]|nr:alpha-ketoacid dehydrogenase subunit beta [Candidatus Aenigmarchaeota archaeon]